MCEGKMPGLLARQGIYSRGRRAAAQECHCHQPARLTSTQYAERALVVVGVVVALALMQSILITLGVVAVLAAAGGVWWRVRSGGRGLTSRAEAVALHAEALTRLAARAEFGTAVPNSGRPAVRRVRSEIVAIDRPEVRR